jgi:hypothetical protein
MGMAIRTVAEAPLREMPELPVPAVTVALNMLPAVALVSALRLREVQLPGLRSFLLFLLHLPFSLVLMSRLCQLVAT